MQKDFKWADQNLQTHAKWAWKDYSKMQNNDKNLQNDTERQKKRLQTERWCSVYAVLTGLGPIQMSAIRARVSFVDAHIVQL